jgi:hypothetical protein
MTNTAVSLDSNGVVTNVIIVGDEVPSGFQRVEVTVGMGQVLAEVEARVLRDALLSATDWTANSDVTMTAEMTTYRQALRDIPAQSGFPNTITWPQEPSI